jgi:hypothetical protein
MSMIACKPALFLTLLASCGGSPTAPVRSFARPAEATADISADREGVALSLSVPGQLVSIRFGDGSIERAWVSGHLSAGTEAAPIGDGAILVVSANDGPMPQSDPTAESLSIRIGSAAVDAAGVISFEGVATTSEGRVVSPPFDVRGTARPTAAPPAPPPPPPPPSGDYIVWDIVGGNLQQTMSLTTRTVVRQRTGSVKPQ